MNKPWFTVMLFIFIVIIFGYLSMDYFLFRNKGERFTAQDGQALCERVQQIDGLPCEYLRR